MVAKTLFTFLPLLCCVIGAAPPALADSYSVSVPSGYSLVANHLNRGSNSVAEVLPVVPDGVVFTKWNILTRSYEPSNSFRLSTGGWALPAQTLQLGEGAWLENPGAPFTLTFQGTPQAPILPVLLTNDYVLISRQRAGAATFEQITGRAPVPGAVLVRYRQSNWIFHAFTEFIGWDPAPPLIPVGEAVFVRGADCPSLAPRPPELLSFSPPEGSTNARDATLDVHFRDPDGQVTAGSAAAVLDGTSLGSPAISAPAPGESLLSWPPPPSLLATGIHSAQFNVQVPAFTQYDFNIPAQYFATSTTFTVQLRPITLLTLWPKDGSTNHAGEKLSFAISDPDSQLVVGSLTLRLDGAVPTNVFIQFVPGGILGVCHPEPLPAAGAHTLTLTYRDIAVPPRFYTNQVVFYTRPPPQIHAALSGGDLTLTWEGSGVLQESDNLVDWTNVPAAASPYQTGTAGQRRFFRLRE